MKVAIVRVGTPEAVLVALVAAGVATGAVSRSFQSEFLDAFFAAALGFSLVPGLCAAAGGGLGARLQYAVRDRLGA